MLQRLPTAGIEAGTYRVNVQTKHTMALTHVTRNQLNLHILLSYHILKHTMISFLPSGCCSVLRNSSTNSLGSPHDGGTFDSQSRWHLYLHSLHFKPEKLKTKTVTIKSFHTDK
jgi:hypothetical protein